MPLFTPTYGGEPIFGLAVHIEQVPDQAAQQLEAFFGVPGFLSVFGGARGRTFQVSGVLYDVDIETLNADEDVFTPGINGSVADGMARTLAIPAAGAGPTSSTWASSSPTRWDRGRPPGAAVSAGPCRTGRFFMGCRSGFQSSHHHRRQSADLFRLRCLPRLDDDVAGRDLVSGLHQPALAWWGQTTNARIAVPTIGPDRVDIGTVLPGEEQTNFSADLPSSPARRAELNWLGGTFEGQDMAGFQVWLSGDASGYGTGMFGDGGYGGAPVTYGDGQYGSGPFGGVDLVELLADITAYPSGIMTDGFGFGGFGLAGWGQAGGTYTWISDPLQNGTYFYAVVPYDSVGNLGTPAVTSVTISAPPLPPAVFPDNTRLHYTYNPSDHEVTLYWNTSPG